MTPMNAPAATKGRPVLGAISGLLFGLFLALDVLFFGVVQLDSVLVTILPPLGLVAGLLLGLWAPLGRNDEPPTAPTAPVAPVAPPAS